jgi:hypothetical protein
MPEFSTIAAVDLGLEVFGSGITCPSNVNGGDADAFGFITICRSRLASAERAQAQADRGRMAGGGNA